MDELLPLKGKDLPSDSNIKKRTWSGAKLFSTFKSDSDLDSDVVLVEDPSNCELDRTRTKRPQRKRQQVAAAGSGTKFELDLGHSKEGVESVTVGFDVPALTPSLKNSSNDEQNGQDGTHSAEEPASNTPLLTEEASASVMLGEHDYEPYNVSNFSAPTELLPSASTPAAAAATSSTINHASTSISHATHKDHGSGLP
ncbi:hypothetical protein EV424DRAFT_1639036 [Suillus variegatus]|nr:hypothetical protein EV424DRAFT_1561086 [Suillus variegatus]KAG1835536.1 hypothetical protein EV424DRAFT_1639036 [Suillus variegatus]